MAAAHREIGRMIRNQGNQRRMPRPRVFRDRSNPLEVLRDDEVFARYRFRPGTIIFIVDLCVEVARDTVRSMAVPPLLAILAYLRFLATGGFQITIGDTINLSQPTLSRLCRQVGQAVSRLAGQFIRFPAGDELTDIKQQFGSLGGFPNVIGTIDCTHVWIKKPVANPEDFIGRKGIPTINVQAICDPTFRIRSAVVMWPGRTHDARIWRQCAIREQFEQGVHQGFLLADSGYACTRYMLTPYLRPVGDSQNRFNGSLCRTRVVIEQTFGILKQRFQVLRRKLNVKPEVACMHIKNSIILHNLGIDRHDIVNFDDFDNVNIQHNVGGQDNRDGRDMRDYICRNYFQR